MRSAIVQNEYEKNVGKESMNVKCEIRFKSKHKYLDDCKN
jgi:hypothetical protein